jgi:hypothetical protein
VDGRGGVRGLDRHGGTGQGHDLRRRGVGRANGGEGDGRRDGEGQRDQLGKTNKTCHSGLPVIITRRMRDRYLTVMSVRMGRVLHLRKK